MWIARKPCVVIRDGKKEILKPGDPVPEAESWKNRSLMIRRGYIEEAPDEIKPKVVPELAVKRPKVEPLEEASPRPAPSSAPRPASPASKSSEPVEVRVSRPRKKKAEGTEGSGKKKKGKRRIES